MPAILLTFIQPILLYVIGPIVIIASIYFYGKNIAYENCQNEKIAAAVSLNHSVNEAEAKVQVLEREKNALLRRLYDPSISNDELLRVWNSLWGRRSPGTKHSGKTSP